MTVETATKISQLLATAPPGTDPKSEGDNHLRLIKGTLQSVFDDSGTTIKTTLPIESPDGAKFAGAVAITGAVTIDGAVTAKGGLTAYETFALAQTATPANLLTFNVSALSAPRVVRVPDVDCALGIWERIIDRTDAIPGGVTIPNLGAYSDLRLRLGVRGITAATAAFGIRVSTDNGATFIATGTSYQCQNGYYQGTAAPASGGQNSLMLLTGGMDSGTSAEFFVQMTDFNQARIGRYQAQGQVITSALFSLVSAGGYCGSPNVYNAIQILSGAGTYTLDYLVEGKRG